MRGQAQESTLRGVSVADEMACFGRCREILLPTAESHHKTAEDITGKRRLH